MKALLIYCLLMCCESAESFEVFNDEELASIGRKIWNNECGGKISGLTSWNSGEEFASLGIGHFIWYPSGITKVFQESFPQLLEYLEKCGAQLPACVKEKGCCPWTSREAFYAAIDTAEMRELRHFLADTVVLQVRFIVERLERTIPAIYIRLPTERRIQIEKQFIRLCSTPLGIFVLLDYLNFKGEGVLPSESYCGKGWGLLQVLEDMEDGNQAQAVASFVAAAKRVLALRVEHAPAARCEGRWLPGWYNRLDRYLSD